jgi:hypothetical protein
MERFDDLWDRARLTTFLLVMTGAAVAALGALIGLNYWLAFVAGLGAAAASACVLWVRARRRGATVLGDY